MHYNFLELFFIFAILSLPWVIEHIQYDRYRKMVLYCCEDVREKAVPLNRLLPDAYKLLIAENANISSLFQEYRSWLLTRYTERKLDPVLSDFHGYLARKNRKQYHPDQLAPYLGTVKEDLFFLETIDYFLEDCNRHGEIGAHKLYNIGYTQDKNTLTDIGIVAYKIMLAAQIARETMGAWVGGAEHLEKMLDKSLPLKGDPSHV